MIVVAIHKHRVKQVCGVKILKADTKLTTEETETIMTTAAHETPKDEI